MSTGAALRTISDSESKVEMCPILDGSHCRAYDARIDRHCRRKSSHEDPCGQRCLHREPSKPCAGTCAQPMLPERLGVRGYQACSLDSLLVPSC